MNDQLNTNLFWDVETKKVKPALNTAVRCSKQHLGDEFIPLQGIAKTDAIGPALEVLVFAFF